MVDGASFEAVKSDASGLNTTTGPGMVPHSAQPMLRLSAEAGWTLMAGADLHLCEDDHVKVAGGQHTDWVTGGA